MGITSGLTSSSIFPRRGSEVFALQLTTQYKVAREKVSAVIDFQADFAIDVYNRLDRQQLKNYVYQQLVSLLTIYFMKGYILSRTHSLSDPFASNPYTVWRNHKSMSTYTLL